MRAPEKWRFRPDRGRVVKRLFSLILLVCAVSLALAVFPGRSASEEGSPGKGTGPATGIPVMRKGPYLLFHSKNTAMTVIWQTYSTPSKTTVEWGASPSYGHGPVTVVEHSAFVDGHQFLYTIGNLSPGKRWYYRITVNGEPFTGSFMTPPEASATVLSFYACGSGVPDPGIQNRLMGALGKDKDAAPDERQTMVLRTGDYVPYGLTELSWDRGLFDRSVPFTAGVLGALPMIGALGRHEGYSQSLDSPRLLLRNIGQYFRKYFPYIMYKFVNRYYYSFDYGPVHVAVLDTWTYPGEMPEARQAEWLREDLKISRKPWKIILVNTPVRDYAFRSKGLEAMFTPVIESTTSDVRLVLQGRQAYYSHVEKNNGAYVVTYLTLGGAGLLEDPAGQGGGSEGARVVKVEKAHHFARFDIKGNVMTVTVMRPDGSVLESFSIDKDLRPKKKEEKR